MWRLSMFLSAPKCTFLLSGEMQFGLRAACTLGNSRWFLWLTVSRRTPLKFLICMSKSTALNCFQFWECRLLLTEEIGSDSQHKIFKVATRLTFPPSHTAPGLVNIFIFTFVWLTTTFYLFRKVMCTVLRFRVIF